MQGYSKGNLGPLLTVYYNGKEEAYMQGCSKGIVGLSITVHFND
jgi:hypothetical protein